MRLFFSVLGLALFIAALVVGWKMASANSGTVSVDLIWLQVEAMPVWQLGLAAFGLGVASTLLPAAFLGARGWLIRRRYRGTIRRLESELHQFQSLPLAEIPDTRGAKRAQAAEA